MPSRATCLVSFSQCLTCIVLLNHTVLYDDILLFTTLYGTCSLNTPNIFAQPCNQGPCAPASLRALLMHTIPVGWIEPSPLRGIWAKPINILGFDQNSESG